jgi:hypothetical protein
MTSKVIFDFDKKSDIKDWKVVVDGVMGGRSSGNFSLNSDGNGVFEGTISLENNGGFSSVRYKFKKIETEGYSKAVLKIKGDGKNYQFRVKSNSGDYYSFIIPFETSGEWQEIEIPLKEMYPSFRGRKLDMPNFANGPIEEITFLIANKRQENFRLLIDEITLQ